MGAENEKIAIIYCTADQFPSEREQERIADSEGEQVAAKVKEALEASGQAADILSIDPDHLDTLVGYAGIFNLAENICGLDNLEYKIASGMESLGLSFTGSSAATLKTCLNKVETKAKIIEQGLLTPAYSVIQPGAPIETDLDFPLFVKPAQEDGSVGVSTNSLVNTQAELIAKVREIHCLYKQPALVEEYIDGRDISVGLIGNGVDLQILPLAEVIYYPGFSGPKVQTFEGSWMERSAAYTNSETVCPSPLSTQTRDLIMAMARRIYNAIGCRDYARIDFRLKGYTPYMLEVNPNPCIHPDGSGFMTSSRAAGLDFPSVVHLILERSMRKQALPYSLSHENEVISQ